MDGRRTPLIRPHTPGRRSVRLWMPLQNWPPVRRRCGCIIRRLNGPLTSSAGRQKTGWADIAPEVQEVLLEEQDLRLRCVQFAHLHPLVDGLDSKAAGTLSGRFEVVLEGSLSVDENAHLLRRSAVGCYVALESYPVGDYAQSVSDLPILRVAALGIPTITTRPDPPPGALHAEPGEWTKTILSLLHQPDHRAELSARARRWAESRSTIAEYTRVLEEV